MKRLLASLVLALALVLIPAVSALAANPEVHITVTAYLMKITNTVEDWDIGIIKVNDVVYFSATGEQDDDYSQVENTGNVAVNVEIQGTDIDGTGALDWVLASTADVEQYCLYAWGGASYNIEVKSSNYTNLVENLPPTGSDKYNWSMKFTAPSAFNANDDGLEKTATITLVASEYIPP